jgi:hypothetical protein
MMKFAVLFFFFLAGAHATCCGACDESAGYAKYYSVDHAHNMCGESCIQPSRFHFYKLFEPGLEPAKSAGESVCRELGYSVYDSTPTHGFGPVKATVDLYKQPEELAAAAEGPCCGACDESAGYAKYYSIDHAHNMCGESCIKPSSFHFYKLFEPGLEPAKFAGESVCRELGYGEYDSTPTHGFGPVKATVDLYKQRSSPLVV